jgi:hypothetical protein
MTLNATIPAGRSVGSAAPNACNSSSRITPTGGRSAVCACCRTLRVDFAGLQVVVNDEAQKHALVPASHDLMQLKFPVENFGAPNLNVLLLNVRGIRPGETGENHDDRLLTARFYGAEFVDA